MTMEVFDCLGCEAHVEGAIDILTSYPEFAEQLRKKKRTQFKVSA